MKIQEFLGYSLVTGNRINYVPYANTYASPAIAASGARRRFSLSFVLMAAAAGLMTAHMIARPSLDRLQQTVFDVAAPAIEFAQKPIEGIRARLDTVAEWTQMSKDNAALRAENEKLKAWYQAALMLQSENKALRDLLNVDRQQAQSFITTRIIADGSSTYAKSLVIEGGRDVGVFKGQGVVSHEGLLGRVIETGSRTARVLLLQDINSRIPVLVEGANERAILAGTNGDMPTLDHLATGSQIRAGERVVTSGLGGLFPYGIPVGETVANGDGGVGVRLYAAPERSQHVQVVDYGIKPLLGDPVFSSTAAATDAGLAEPN
ncbi:MAG: rod shape-determining protein MreC [Rhodospirillales bacterium]|nr:rod shape-determining protein MreC [Alphaproteobacteria bacterium]MCB9987012.1 rod shape-determining protein MreC [Rhodospirillales bacterium]USO08215.1 MAG: rod shape-determining protein MreC [Rhodospirillales bacterium]